MGRELQKATAGGRLKVTLNISDNELATLHAHLLPPASIREEAAFLVVAVNARAGELQMIVADMIKLTGDDFLRQESDYLELSDNARATVIKRAHVMKGALIEVHSHPAPWQAMFSIADMRGLADTVPHMQWRLPKRPYVAIVVAPHGFDALVWHAGAKRCTALSHIRAGARTLLPTNRTIGALHGR